MAEEEKAAGNRRARLVRLRPEALSGAALEVMSQVLGRELKEDRDQAERFLKKFGIFKERPAV